MSDLEIPVRKRSRIDQKEMMPLIFFELREQQAVWECILKDEIDAGVWANVKFEKNRYLLAKTFVKSDFRGITFPPSQMSFYFDNIEFVKENGYYIALVMKLARAYILTVDEMKSLAQYVESFIMTDFKDDNSNYRRIQVMRVDIDSRNVPETHKEAYRQTEAYFKNRGIDMEHVIKTIKHEPITVKEVRKLLVDLSALIKEKADITALQKSLSEL